MKNWYNFILKIKPDGKAFKSILFSKIFYEVLAYSLNLVKEYAVLRINDQVWFVNSNFDPAPWELRYQLNVPELATIEERRILVKSCMMFPRYSNRLSKDYIQNSLHDSGFSNLEIQYNPSNVTYGILRANDISDEKGKFAIGSLIYNTFIVTGNITEPYYYNAINLVHALKPLQIPFYDTIDVLNTLAFRDEVLDDDYVFALDAMFYKNFGSTGTGNGQFNFPSGVAVNSTNLFVIDDTNYNVQKFTLEGVFVSKFGSYGTGNGQFHSLSGIAVDEQYIYIVDNANARVQIFTTSGVYVSRFGTYGSNDGQFITPRGIAINDNYIYVIDTGNNRVQVFDKLGQFINKFGTSGNGNGEFNTPHGISLNSEFIFVMDTLNYRIQLFSLDGTYNSKFGSHGTGNGQFSNTLKIATSAQYIYAADINRGIIQRFNLSGGYIDKIELNPYGLYGVAYKNGMIYSTDTSDDKINIHYDYQSLAITVI
jgi:hypothetical protein